MYPWTVYLGDELVDIAGDDELREFLRMYRTVYVNYGKGIVQIVE